MTEPQIRVLPVSPDFLGAICVTDQTGFHVISASMPTGCVSCENLASFRAAQSNTDLVELFQLHAHTDFQVRNAATTAALWGIEHDDTAIYTYAQSVLDTANALSYVGFQEELKSRGVPDSQALMLATSGLDMTKLQTTLAALREIQRRLQSAFSHSGESHD